MIKVIIVNLYNDKCTKSKGRNRERKMSNSSERTSVGVCVAYGAKF